MIRHVEMPGSRVRMKRNRVQSLGPRAPGIFFVLRFDGPRATRFEFSTQASTVREEFSHQDRSNDGGVA